MTCLHALEGEAAARLSLPVIRGVSQTSLEGALALVEQGDATREDFWVFVGCAGWAPKQLEAEVDDGTWLMASADSATLLRELLSQGTALQPRADEDATAVEAPHGAFGDGGGAVAAAARRRVATAALEQAASLAGVAEGTPHAADALLALRRARCAARGQASKGALESVARCEAALAAFGDGPKSSGCETTCVPGLLDR